MTLTDFLKVRVRFVAVVGPLALVACDGGAFSSGPGGPDGSVDEAGPDGDIILGPDAGRPQEGGGDASTAHDARPDAPEGKDATTGEGGEGLEGGEGGEIDSGGHDAAVEAGCPAGYLDCAGTCTLEGVTNCGTCGHDCATLPHVGGGVTCGAGGVCTFTSADCAAGWAHCTSNPDDGCETSTATSPNCGGCGTVCSAGAGTPVCNGSICVSGCTAPKSTLCNGTTCVDTTSDPQNCNGCGTVCHAPVNGATSCASSNCQPSCSGAYPDLCANEGVSGSCVNFANDTNNCGGCTNTCPGPVAGTGTATCAGACGVTCSGLTPNACGIEPSIACVNFQGDVNNCGSCGNACGKGANRPPPADGSSICATGTCDFQCTSGYTKCEAQWECLAPPLTGSAFVAAGSGFTPASAGGCGTAAQPCQNLSDGVAYAEAQGYANLYVAHGLAYGSSDGPIVLAPTAALTVQGGWTYSAGTWSADCAPTPSSTVIVTPAGGALAVEIESGAVALQMLTIVNATTAAASQSLYGVLVNGATSVTLTSVDVQVAAGGNGSNGTIGASGQPVGSTCFAGNGANGTTPGGQGNPGAASYTSSQYVAGTGGTGGTGSSGANGTAAPTPAPCVNDVSCRDIGGICQPNTTSSCGSVGSNGCGSTGGGGGSGGGGGGASIGVYVGSNTPVTVNGGTITTGNGGTGGPGGPPGAQVPGTPGHVGGAGSTVCEQDSNCGTAPSCLLSCAKTGAAAGGAAGGMGGEGAAGGNGGGGAGGDSHCYATVGSGMVTLTSVACSTGSAGGGGSPNGPGGSNAVHN